MRKLTFKIVIAFIAFVIGIIAVGVWVFNRSSYPSEIEKFPDCTPTYDSSIDTKLTKDKAKVFIAFKEIPFELLPSCVDESYRLIWIPTFHSSVALRIWRSGETYFMVAKQLDGKDGYGMGNLSFEQTRALTKPEWLNFINQINQAEFWTTPSIINEPLPNDGATWIIEGLKDKQVHSIKRVSLNDKYAELIKYMMNKSGLETEYDKYLP